MRMGTRIAAVALLITVGTASVAVAAEPCRPATGPGAVDSAFAGPGGCARAPARKPDTAAKGWTTTPDGKRVWSDGGTSLSVSGSVGFDVTTGNARVTPGR